MVNLRPEYKIPQDPHIQDNLLSNINGSQEQPYINVGFACVMNQFVPDNYSSLFLRCYTNSRYHYASLDSVYLTDFAYVYPNAIWETEGVGANAREHVDSGE